MLLLFYKILIGHTDHIKINTYLCHYMIILLSSSSSMILSALLYTFSLFLPIVIFLTKH